MTVGLPPAAVRRASTVALVQAVVLGGAALIVALLTLATYTQDNPPDGKTLSDVWGPLALETGAVILGLTLGFAAQRFRRGSESARRTMIGAESVVALAGLALGVVSLRYGLAGGGGVWLVVLAPAVLALVALTGAASRAGGSKMTPTASDSPVTPSTPGSIITVRILVGVQAVLGLVGAAGAVMVGLVAAFGFALQIDMDTDGTAFVVGLAAMFGVTLALVCGLLTATVRLGRGQRGARVTLIGLQFVVLVGVLPLAAVMGGLLRVSGVPVPAVVLGGCAVVSLVALFARPTRLSCRP